MKMRRRAGIMALLLCALLLLYAGFLCAFSEHDCCCCEACPVCSALQNCRRVLCVSAAPVVFAAVCAVRPGPEESVFSRFDRNLWPTLIARKVELLD